jgi:hypothetical protein
LGFNKSYGKNYVVGKHLCSKLNFSTAWLGMPREYLRMCFKVDSIICISIFFFLIIFPTSSFAQQEKELPKNPKDLIPDGFVIRDEVVGDLNKNGVKDHLFIIKGTDKSRIIKDESRGWLDMNRRGIVIVFSKNNHYELALLNQALFSSEDCEQLGVYGCGPEVRAFIENGVIRFHYYGGRYGYWAYKFRYQHSDFELIGYDSSSDHGPITMSTTSINLSTKRMRKRENVHPDIYDGGEKYEETWIQFKLPKAIELKEIEALDDFDIYEYIEIVENK